MTTTKAEELAECWINPDPKHPDDWFSRFERAGWVRFVPASVDQQAERDAMRLDYSRLLEKHNNLHTNAARDRAERDALAQHREPLTDGQIVAAANEAFDTTIDLDDETLVNKYGHGIYISRYLDFARAIEAAHGIGATTGEQR